MDIHAGDVVAMPTVVCTEGRGPELRSSRKIDDIEVLRGFAILFVLFEHVRFNLLNWATPALDHIAAYFTFWSGVDIFFAISGFVIARSLLPKLDQAETVGDFVDHAIRFWLRRFWRLIPSAWLWLGLILTAAVFFNRTGAFGLVHSNFQSAVAAIVDLANFHFIQLFGKTFIGASFPYWSLSLEEQFYILLPIVAFFSRRRLPIVLSILVAAQLPLPRLHSFLIIIRSDALLLGVLIAIWGRHQSYRLFEPSGLAKTRLIRGTILFGLLAAIAALSPTDPPVVPVPIGCIALISALLVLIASYDRDYLMKRGPIKNVFIWLGSRSYGLYLIHIPVYCATREIWYRIEPVGTVFGGTFTFRFGMTAAILLVCLAELNYRLIETPLRRRGVRIAESLEFPANAPALQPGGG